MATWWLLQLIESTWKINVKIFREPLANVTVNAPKWKFIRHSEREREREFEKKRVLTEMKSTLLKNAWIKSNLWMVDGEWWNTMYLKAHFQRVYSNILYSFRQRYPHKRENKHVNPTVCVPPICKPNNHHFRLKCGE